MASLNPIAFSRKAARNSPWLVIAVALHAVVIAVMSVIYLAGDRDNAPKFDPIVKVAPPQEAPIEPPEPDLRRAPPENLPQDVVEMPEIEYTLVDTSATPTEEVGNPDGEGTGEASGATPIGTGGDGHYGNGVSPFPGRGTGPTPKRGGLEQATQPTRAAVLQGLLWLSRHQQPDGSWDATRLPACCVNEKCCVSPAEQFPEFWQEGLTGLSLLAFLGAGYNFDSKQIMRDEVRGKKFFVGEVVRNGLKWLKNRQQPDGSFGPDQHVYNQALCTLALAEAYGLSRNLTWKEPAQRAVDWLVRAEKTNPENGGLWGWRYHSRDDVQALKEKFDARKQIVDEKRAPLDARRAELDLQRSDLEKRKDQLQPAAYELELSKLREGLKEVDRAIAALEPELEAIATGLREVVPELYDSDLSVTTWVVMAFKSAEASGLNIPREAFEGGRNFVLSVSNEDGLAGYTSRNNAGRPVGGRGDKYRYHVGTMSALSMLCRTFVDHDIDDPFLEKAAQSILADVPDVSKDKLSIDYYYWYYASLALNQFDGPESPRKGRRYWDPWNRAMTEALLGTQDKTERACTHGGWIIPDRWSLSAGPIYATALNVLTLEVYYRYENAFGSGARFNRGPKKPK